MKKLIVFLIALMPVFAKADFILGESYSTDELIRMTMEVVLTQKTENLRPIEQSRLLRFVEYKNSYGGWTKYHFDGFCGDFDNYDLLKISIEESLYVCHDDVKKINLKLIEVAQNLAHEDIQFGVNVRRKIIKDFEQFKAKELNQKSVSALNKIKNFITK